MQTPDESEIDQELRDSYDFQVIEKSIDDLAHAIEVIKNGMQDEFNQVNELKSVIKRQESRIVALKSESVVSMKSILEEENYLRFCKAALKQSSTALSGLNGFLNDRLKQMNELKRARQSLINRHSLAKVIPIKG